MDLNTTNIDTILLNISCCIDDLSKQLCIYAQTGNKKCFKSTRNKILVLDRLYKILKKNYKITYPIYNVQAPLITTLTPSILGLVPALVVAATLTDLDTGLVIATGYNSSVQTYPVIYALQQLISNLQTNTSYTATFTYSAVTTSLLKGLSFTVNDYNCPINNLRLKIFNPYVDTPPYAGVDPTIVVKLMFSKSLTLIQEGNCTSDECFTVLELEDLYNKALKMCKLCNCS